MPSLVNINQRVRERLLAAGLTLTIVYPPVRPVPTGSSPGTLTISPLTGPAEAQTVFPTVPTGYIANVSMPCLWLDSMTGRETSDVANTELREVKQAGWVVGATSMARVLVDDAALDPTNPYVGTKFDAADYVLFRGDRFRVIQSLPMGASFGPPTTYHIWMEGLRKV